MWQKVVWITFWMTLAFWVGCARDGQVGLQTRPIIESSAPLVPPGVPGAGTPAATPHANAAIQAADAAVPSLRGVDRSNWEPIVVGPVSGAVPHHPEYFNEYFFDCYVLTPDRPSPLVGEDTNLDASAVASTADNRAHINLRDLRDLVVAPLKTASDLVTLPAQATITPPWTIQYSSGIDGEPINGQP